MRTLAEQAYFTLAEAAEFVRLSESTLKAAVYNDELRSCSKEGAKHVFSRADLDAWMKARAG